MDNVVFHMSKVLTKTQQSYNQIEKEALALVRLSYCHRVL